jgi:hypothetical protein
MTVRPERVAYLVDPADPAIALAAIESACLTWGGKRQYLIPCAPGGRPDEVWLAILTKHDPDVILDLVGAENGFLQDQRTRLTRQIDRWERPTETMEIVGAVVFAALRRWKRMRSTGKTRIAVNLHPLAGHPLALPLAFRFGHLDPRPMDQDMVIEQSYRSAQIGDFVDLREVDPWQLGEAECMRLATDIVLGVSDLAGPPVAGTTVFHDLPQLTSIGLPTREPSYMMGGAPSPEREQHDEAYLSRLVVVGSPDSVQDLCLAWNLRVQRPSLQFFPQWISPEWSTDGNVLQSIHWGLRWENAGLSEDRRAPSLHLLSATLSPDELTAATPELGAPVVSHDRAGLDRFFSPGLHVGIDQVSVANFHRGRADVAVPDYAQLGDWQYWERIGWTADIAGYAPPRVSRNLIPWNGTTPVRSAADGLGGFINVPHVEPGELWSFPTSSGWDMVAAVSEQAGYRARIDEKGQRAIAVIRLLGGEPGLRLLASSRVYGLIEAMSETDARQAAQRAARRAMERLAIENLTGQQIDAIIEAVRADVTEGAQFDRQHLDWGQVKEVLGGRNVPRDLCDRVVSWLVERRVLFQGYKFQCENCGLARWHSINLLSDTQICEGCGHSTAKPGSTNQLAWRYRLNETIARAVDQGQLPHLLAVNRMLAWRHDDRAPLTGVLPGVVLSPRDAAGPEAIEVDIFAIKGRRVIVGECKRGGDRITDRTIDRIAAAAQRLNCSRVVFATASRFDDAAVPLERAREVILPSAIEIWDQAALFDCWNAGRQDDPVEYLQRAASTL